MADPSTIHATHLIEVEITATLIPGLQSVVCGPVSAWREGEPDQVEIHSIEYAGLQVRFTKEKERSEVVEIEDRAIREEIETAVVQQHREHLQRVKDFEAEK